MKYFRRIVGERLYLSPINPDDVEILTKWANDLETTVPMGHLGSCSLINEREVLERLAKSEHLFAIVRYDEDSEKMIGNGGLFEIDHVNRRAMLTIRIGDSDARGKGYGSEAIGLMLEHGFGLLNLENIMLTVASYNTRGIECYKKCGFCEIGRRRNAIWVNNEPYDNVYMDIIRSEFKGDIRDRLPMYFDKGE